MGCLRRFFVVLAWLANAVATGFALGAILNGYVWGKAALIAASDAMTIVVLCAIAFPLNVLLGLLLFAGSRSRRRERRRLEERLAALEARPRTAPL